MEIQGRVLLCGFSVTEQSAEGGYAPRLEARLRKKWPDLKLDRKAIGGIPPTILACEFDRILSDAQYRYVFLEISTAPRLTPGVDLEFSYAWPLAVMVAKIYTKGSLPVIIHLYRADVDYSSDLLSAAYKKIAMSFSIPFLDIASEVELLPELERLSFLLLTLPERNLHIPCLWSDYI